MGDLQVWLYTWRCDPDHAGPESHLCPTSKSLEDKDARLWCGHNGKQVALWYCTCDVSKVGPGGVSAKIPGEGSLVSFSYLFHNRRRVLLRAQRGGLLQFIPEANFQELPLDIIDNFISKKRCCAFIWFVYLL